MFNLRSFDKAALSQLLEISQEEEFAVLRLNDTKELRSRMQALGYGVVPLSVYWMNAQKVPSYVSALLVLGMEWPDVELFGGEADAIVQGNLESVTSYNKDGSEVYLGRSIKLRWLPIFLGRWRKAAPSWV